MRAVPIEAREIAAREEIGPRQSDRQQSRISASRGGFEEILASRVPGHEEHRCRSALARFGGEHAEVSVKELAGILRRTPASLLQDHVVPMLLPDSLGRVSPEPEVLERRPALRYGVDEKRPILVRADLLRHPRHLVEVRQAVADEEYRDVRGIARHTPLRANGILVFPQRYARMCFESAQLCGRRRYPSLSRPHFRAAFVVKRPRCWIERYDDRQSLAVGHRRVV